MFGSEGFGIFNGEGGANQHYQIKELPLSNEGVTFEVTCDTCGTTQRITIGWQQIAQAAAVPRTNQLPVDPDNRQPWLFKDGKIHPNIGCVNGNCRQPIYIGLTPDEAMKKLMAGQQAGFVRLQG